MTGNNKTNPGLDKKAVREKRLVAFSSVVAAVFLTATKLAIGLLTGSLGILSEAAHSGLDLVAAGVTFFSVRASDRPPDIDHTYGHGKIENFSALIETVLLFITCGWIIYEAVHRLVFRVVEVEVTFWSFLVMGLSIVIDFSRSRALMRTAKKHGSQALEADAIHFSTDILSSSVVILGLIAVSVGVLFRESNPGLASWLFRADAMAALGVALVVIYVSWRLGSRAVRALMDAAPRGLNARIRDAVVGIPGVLAVDRVRTRQSGPTSFVDLTLEVARTASLEEAHHIAGRAEDGIRGLLPRADVMVHVEPLSHGEEGLIERVYRTASAQGLDIHDLHLHDIRGNVKAEMHAEVPPSLSVSEAHDRVSALEKELHRKVPEISETLVHIEPAVSPVSENGTAHLSVADIRDAVAEFSRQEPGLGGCHDLSILRGSDVSVSLHCTVKPDMSIVEAHNVTERFERMLRQRLPGIDRVIIHVEPPEEG